MKQLIKTVLPEQAVQSLRNAYDGIKRIPDDIHAVIDPIRRESIKRIRRYKNIFAGERCFIIGNGPSLRKTNLSKLEGEFTFGMNRIFLMFPELGFPTTFLVSVNDLVLEQSASNFQKLDIPRFVSYRALEWLQPEENLLFLYTTYTGPKFSKNAAGRLWEGATVTYTCLQLAFYFGFSEVVLIGVDHSFATQGKPNMTITSQGDDENHFHPKYFGKGFRWQLPDLDTSEISYAMARKAFEDDGRKIIDATIGGKLTVFPKVKYEDLF
jgi:hypothetical protein